MKKNLIYFILILALASSCKSTKKVINNTPVSEAETYLEKHQLTKPDYTTMSIKFSAKYQSPTNNMAFSGQIRIKKDSIVWFSLSPGLGIEIIRGILTKDSLFYINKMENSYLAEDYKYIDKKFKAKLNFFDIQSIITNTVFAYTATGNTQLGTYNAITDSVNHCLASHTEEFVNQQIKSGLYKQSHLITQKLFIDKLSFHYKQTIVNDLAFNRKINVEYSDFYDIADNRFFPKGLTLEFSDGSKIEALLLNYTKTEINKVLEFPFSISSKLIKQD